MNSQDLPALPPQSLPQSIRATLCFFDLFDCPLTFEELKFYLLSSKSWADEELLDTLKNDEQIVLREGYYCLKSSQGHVNTRKVRSTIADEYYKKLRRYLPLIRIIPFVKMVAVCNTLAFGCPTAKSDIDLFIVAKKNRLFIVRTLTTVLFHIMGVRRHGDKVAGRFCLSFFISDDQMDLSSLMKDQNDIYFLYWLRTLKPVYGEETFAKFLQANNWTEKYFANPHMSREFWKSGRLFTIIARIKEFFLWGFIGNFYENFLAKKHLKRHAQKAAELGEESSVVVNRHILKYHNVDRRAEYREKFYDKLRKL